MVLSAEVCGDTFSLSVGREPSRLSSSSLARPLMDQTLHWFSVGCGSQSRWLPIDMQGGLSNAGSVVMCYWRQGEMLNGV